MKTTITKLLGILIKSRIIKEWQKIDDEKYLIEFTDKKYDRKTN